MLKLMQRDMPARFRDRVPRLLAAETDAAGFTRILRMTWLATPAPSRPAGKATACRCRSLNSPARPPNFSPRSTTTSA